MIFPLAAPVLQVLLNGMPVRTYGRAYLERGRVMAPLSVLNALAASTQIDGTTVIARRGDRFTEAALVHGYLAIAPVLRALGASVRYDKRTRSLLVALAAQPLATPTPFNRAVPQPSPRSIFTHVPVSTPKPAVTGKPVPRRTPPSVTVSAPGTPPPALRRP